MVLSTMSTTYLWILFSPNSTHVKKTKKIEKTKHLLNSDWHQPTFFNSESLSLQTTRPIIIWRVFFCQSALPWCIIASRDTISGGRSKSDPNFLKVFVCASLQKLRQKSCFLCIYNQVCSLVIRERSGWHQMHFHILWLHSLLLNTSYLIDSYIVFTLKMESASKNTIFGLKMMVKSGLKNLYWKNPSMRADGYFITEFVIFDTFLK